MRRQFCAAGSALLSVHALLALTSFAIVLLNPAHAVAQDAVIPRTFEPRESYVAYRISTPLRIDGVLSEGAWAAAPWTNDFVDIEGAAKPRPPLRTRAKMLWDDEYLYIAAELVEPDVWGTITQRDSVIFFDNDFEVFIDPDGDTQEYYELEINALATVWDLRLTKAYRDGGRALDDWNITGLLHAVHVDGTINRGRDSDRGWTVELALPWSLLREYAFEQRRPRNGEQWRINFSRVEWDADATDAGYVKRRNAEGKLLPEHNWVWSPQGAINMHMPERWGTVQFSGRTAGTRTDIVRADPEEAVRDGLRALYYAQRRFNESHRRYATTLADLAPLIEAAHDEGRVPRDAALAVTTTGYRISARATNGTLHITEDGRMWRDQ
ncbi:MAG: carbohydrate-binding family 9-like protein [Longimicrobiales bacterium]